MNLVSTKLLLQTADYIYQTNVVYHTSSMHLHSALLTVGDSIVLFAFLFFLILYGAPAMSLTL